MTSQKGMQEGRMNEDQLDSLFAEARVETAADAGAAERFLAGHRSHRQHQRQVRAGWVSVLLASAAVVTGVVVLRPAADAPASAAYQVYEESLGDGW